MPAPRPRRTPKQDRSRERVEAIVEATRRLVGARGNDAVSMREIATEAGVPIASVYQYFPDKNAILRVLIVGYLDEIKTELAGALSAIETSDDLPGAAQKTVDTLVKMFRRDPALGTIWSAVQANTVLRDLDMTDTREIAEFLTALFLRVLPSADKNDVLDACLYAAHTVANTIRVAHQAPKKDGERLIREVKKLMHLRVSSLVEHEKKTKRRTPRGR